MEDSLRSRIEDVAEVQALVNAIKHDGSADVGAIMGPLMADHPQFREYADEIPAVIAPVVDEVNDLDLAEQRTRLEERDPEMAAALVESDDQADEEPTLPPLPNAETVETVRMRCAPNPNGPWHIGHARMPAVIGTYRDRYDGWFCLRFDDTDPETKRPHLDAYEQIVRDTRYLGFEPDGIYRASDRLELYYDHARRLIDLGHAYTCSCSAEEFSAMKNAGEACPHRKAPADRTQEEFQAMIDGDVESGDRVLRVKTDIDHANPAVRDWVAFRMVDTPHPRPAASDYRCWPMLDFQSGIDDHDLGITHVIRGIDLQDSAKRQRYVYDAFGWEYPEVLHWGHVQIDEYDVSMSTSTIASLIESGQLDGWDDPRAPTLQSLRRRGIDGDAVTGAMIGLGMSTSDVDLAMSAIYAKNRELIDESADRRFLVRDGIERQLIGELPSVASVPVHPDDPDRGDRSIPVTDSVFVEPDDLPSRQERVWLKGLGCVRVIRDALELTDDDIDAVRSDGVPVVHWVPADSSVPVRLRTPEGDVSGRGEPTISTDDPDTVVQFERVGFARVDRHEEDETVAYFAHG